MSAVKATVQPKRATKQTPRKQLQRLKGGIATAVKLLREVQDDVDQIDPLMFVCIAALRAQRGDDLGPVSAVLETAYDKLVLDVNEHVRDALKALGQDGAG